MIGYTIPRIALRTAAVIGWALAWIVPLAAPALERIPFTSVDGGLIQVQGTVGVHPATMLVDLGAGIDILSTTLGARVAHINGKYATLRLTGQRADLPIGTVASIALGEFRVDNRNVAVWKGLDGTGIDGLISATAFRNVATTFDFHAHEILIEDAETFAQRKLFAARVPLVLQDDLGIALGVLARFDFGNGKSGLCTIDTGRQGITIDKIFAPLLGVNLDDPSLKHTHTAFGDGIAATIPSLTMIGAPQTALQRPNVVFADLVYDCSVGNDFWLNKKFTLDIPEHAIFVPAPG